MDHARKGDAALSAGQYDEAVQHYTDALTFNSTAVKYYISRSTAYQRSKKYTEALNDAEVAVVLANKRATRELIKDAQFRRGVALFHQGKYADARYLFNLAKELDPKDKMVPIWEAKVEGKFKDVPEDDERRKVTVQKVPDVQLPSGSVATKETASSKEAAPSEEAAPSKGATSTKSDTPVEAPKPVVPTPVNKIKHDWYQSNETVTINILAKGVPKDSATVEIEKDTLFISFPVSGSESDYSYNLDPLYESIDPTQSTYRVTPNKVEVTLRKASAGVKWHDLENQARIPKEERQDSTIPSHILTAKPNDTSGPVYPTSSKTGTKNWDKLATEDLDDKDDMEGDETSHFFKKLYKGASAEQQRAMMKSYSESGGTVLSTDWRNVGDRTVVPEPPEGMVARKY